MKPVEPVPVARDWTPAQHRPWEGADPLNAERKTWLQYLDAIVGISVVLSLIVLIIEVRDNSLALERQVYAERVASVAAPLISTTHLLSAYRKVKTKDGWEPTIQNLMDEYGMEPEEAIAWSRMLLGIWRGLENDYLTLGDSETLRTSVGNLLYFPDNRLYWQDNREWFDPGFRAIVETELPAQ